jgi:hypothetical protein
VADGSPLSKPCRPVENGYLEAFQLPSTGWALLLQGNHLVYCFEINARVIAALCSFVCLFVCLFQEPGKIPEEEKLLTIVLPFHSNLECCQCRVGDPGTAEL